MKIAFVGTPLKGHLIPALRLLNECSAHGHEVVYWLPHRFTDYSQSLSGKVYYYESTVSNVDKLIDDNLLTIHLLNDSLTCSIGLLEELRLERPDCLIADTACPWSMVLAEALGIPLYQTHTMCVPSPSISIVVPESIIPVLSGLQRTEMVWLDKSYRRLYKLCGLNYPGTGISYFEGKLVLVFVPSWFDEKSDETPKKFDYIGPILSPDQFDFTGFHYFREDQRIKVYFSMGTIFNNDITLTQILVDTLAGRSDYELVISCTSSLHNRIKLRGSNNVSLYSEVNQCRILTEADIFVSHAGINSVMESLYASTPLLQLPNTFEQQQNAERVKRGGYGSILDKNSVTRKLFFKALEELHFNSRIKNNVAIASEKLRSNRIGNTSEVILKKFGSLNDARE